MSIEKPEPVQFDVFVAHAREYFDVVASGSDITVERDGDLVRLSPVRRIGKRSARHFSASDPLWDIVGIGHSEGPTDVSAHKHAYLADAKASRSRVDSVTED